MQQHGITVELEGEIQKLTFPKPIKGIKGKNIKGLRKIWFSGLITGIAIASVFSVVFEFSHTNTPPRNTKELSQKVKSLQKIKSRLELHLAKLGRALKKDIESKNISKQTKESKKSNDKE